VHSADSFAQQLPGLIETVVGEVKKFQDQLQNQREQDQTPKSVQESILKPYSTGIFGEPRRPFCRRSWRESMDNNSPNNREGRHRRKGGCRYFRLQNKGLRLLEEKKFPEAIHCFQKMARCFPTDYIARYNLACSFSLLSATKEASIEKEMAQQNALEALRQAISIGYNNASHMNGDSDLDPIRARPEFGQIFSRLNGAPEQQQEEPQEQKPQEQEKKQVSFELPVFQEAEEEPEQNPVQILIEQPFELPEFEPEQPAVPEVEQSQKVEIQEDKEIVEPEQDAAKAFFAEELKQLHDMGFLDTQKNLEQLKKCNGDIFQVIAQLLD